MKKTILAFVVMATLVSCGGASTDVTTPASDSVAVVADSVVTPLAVGSTGTSGVVVDTTKK